MAKHKAEGQGWRTNGGLGLNALAPEGMWGTLTACQSQQGETREHNHPTEHNLSLIKYLPQKPVLAKHVAGRKDASCMDTSTEKEQISDPLFHGAAD